MPEEAEGEWRTLTGPDELVEFYDPTDVFGDLADALAEAYPAVAPEMLAAGSDIDDARPRRRRGRRSPTIEVDDEPAADGRPRRPPTPTRRNADEGAEGRPTA